MPGIYNRNNMDLQSALEAALKNRQQFEKREEDRRKARVDDFNKGVKSIGDDLYSDFGGMSDADIDKRIEKLQTQLAEAKEQQRYEAAVQSAYDDQVKQRSAVDYYLRNNRAQNNYAVAMGSRDYQGYHTTPASVANSIPDYSEILKRRGLY